MMHAVNRLMLFGGWWRVGRRDGSRWDVRIVKAYSGRAALEDFRRLTGDDRCFAERVKPRR